jgi:hypothetical protein
VFLVKYDTPPLEHLSSFLNTSHKDRFAEDPERYARFLKAFTEIYGTNAPDRSYEARISLIRAEMKDDIFKDHVDLLESFESFIPEFEPGVGQVEEIKAGEDHRNTEGEVETPT